MEGHEIGGRPSGPEQAPQPLEGEDPFDEILPQPRIGEAAFFLDGQRRHPGNQRGREQSPAGAFGHPATGIDLHTLHPTARRVLLENIAAQVLGAEGVGAPIGVACELLGDVGAALHQDQRDASRIDRLAPAARRRVGRHEAHRFPRRAEAGLHLRAHRHPFDVRTEHLDEERITLVPCVVADRFPEQTCRDADPGPVVVHPLILLSRRQGGAMRKTHKTIGDHLERFSEAVTAWTGGTSAFTSALAVIAIWAALGPVFRYSDTWQLVINTGTTIVTFLMVFLIQRSQNKGTVAIQLKLNELVAAMVGASNRLIDVESLSEKELAVLERHYRELARLCRTETDLTQSHSLDEARHRHRRKATTTR
jgi:low affinity Fe/Cu permease